MLKILFVCTGNICRSPMAEALLKHELDKVQLPFKVFAFSAGLSAMTGEKASGPARQLMLAEGIYDLESHSASNTNEEKIEDADLILVMTANHRRQLLSLYPHAANKTYLLKEFAAMEHAESDIEDPMGLDQEKYCQVLEEIRASIQKIMLKFKEEHQKR